jgi:hypothetical protein
MNRRSFFTSPLAAPAAAWAALRPMRPGAESPWMGHYDVRPPMTDPARNQIGARPTNRDLIVDDCPPCAGARSFIMPARRMVVRLPSGEILG